MKKLLIVFALLFVAPVFAFHGKGFTLDGVDTNLELKQSRTVKMTILKCGEGRMRSVRNYTAKCRVRATRRGIARDRTSRILQREAPRYRGTRAMSKTPVYRTENLIQRSKRMREARRAKKITNN